ncbi:hypothetical protein [Streptomyces sp. NPDC007205]|uniref:hypothetical protein n=1 Tax=Streptomyces sp. NPDC007205 TaxID=3154316 RepID=UPI00340CE252
MSTCKNTARRPVTDDSVQRLAAYDELAVSARDFLAAVGGGRNVAGRAVTYGQSPRATRNPTPM